MAQSKQYKVDTSKPVCVTGATGFVAGVLIEQLLQNGVDVHATCRDPSNKDKIKHLEEVAKKSSSKGTIKYFKADLLDEESFAEAMEGCEIVFHTASPFSMSPDLDPRKDLVEPAVNGTTNVLNQVSKTPSVKRVVLTSSVAAIFSDAYDCYKKDNKKLTEEDWNRTASLDYKPYYLSKTLAETKAWVMAGSQTQWKLVTINPGFIMGPGLKYHSSAQSFQIIKSLGDGTFGTSTPAVPLGVADVRNVAEAHIAAAYTENAAGRHIVCGHNTTMDKMAKAIGEKYAPEYNISMKTKTVPTFLMYASFPFLGTAKASEMLYNIGYDLVLDNTKSKEELGIDYIPLEKTLQEMFQQVIDAGDVKPKNK